MFVMVHSCYLMFFELSIKILWVKDVLFLEMISNSADTLVLLSEIKPRMCNLNVDISVKLQPLAG